MSSLNILYIGSLDHNSNSFRRYTTLKQFGKVDAVENDFSAKGIWIQLQYYFYFGPDVFRLNRRIRAAAKPGNYDMIWVDNKSYLWPRTFASIRKNSPSTKVLSLLTDDPNGKYRKSWWMYRLCAPLFDIHFVQRTVNVNEVLSWGGKRVELCFRSFDPEFHRPVEAFRNKSAECVVGFVGTYEKYREEFIAYLIENGIPVKVTGNDWKNGDRWETIRPHYQGPSIFGEGYIRSMCELDIALHFIRKANRDEQDSRTFEIPACKVFMIAERTGVHEMLFEENKEVVFFEEKQELLRKVRQYMALPQQRETMADAAYERCFRSGYDHRATLQRVIHLTLNRNYGTEN